MFNRKPKTLNVGPVYAVQARGGPAVSTYELDFAEPPSPQADILRQLMDAVEEMGLLGGSFGATGSVTDGHTASVTIADDLGGRYYITCTSARQQR